MSEKGVGGREKHLGLGLNTTKLSRRCAWLGARQGQQEQCKETGSVHLGLWIASILAVPAKGGQCGCAKVRPTKGQLVPCLH